MFTALEGGGDVFEIQPACKLFQIKAAFKNKNMIK